MAATEIISRLTTTQTLVSALALIVRLVRVHHRAGGGIRLGDMSQRVRVRRLSGEEGRQLQRILRRGGGKTMVSVVRYSRAMVVLASAARNTVGVIARLVETSPDRVREMIHRFNEMGMASLDPQVGGWPSPPDND